MKQISRKDAVNVLVDSDMESIMSGDKVGRQTLRTILESGSPEYDMMEIDELEEALLGAFDEEYKVTDV